MLDTDMPGDQRELAETAKHSAESLLRVINDILDFSKIEAGKLEIVPGEVDLRGLLSQIEKTFNKRLAEKNLTFIVQVAKAVPEYAFTDEMRVRQILINLVGNAVKFTDPGGVIVLVCAVEQVTGRLAQDKVLQFTIVDTGMGIEEEKQERIFEAFAQADASMTRKYGGTGLGLSISSQLVELLGGEIGLRSSPGAGSAFHVSLPLVEVEKHAQSSTTTEEQQHISFDGSLQYADAPHVLLAEDNEVNQTLAVKLLEKLGCRVSVANNGREAVEAFSSDNGFDVVLMDMQMPEMGGEEASAVIRKLPGGEKVPIVAITAHALTGDRERYLNSGLDGYIAKPIVREQLAETLGKLLKREHLSSGGLV